MKIRDGISSSRNLSSLSGVIALESMQYPGSYLDAGGDRKAWTAEKDYDYNNYRKWKVINLGDNVVALESMKFPGSYLDAGGDRKAWTAEKDYDYNNYRKWKVVDIGNNEIALESMQFPGSYLDAGGDRKAWTAQKDYSYSNYRKWKVIKIDNSIDGGMNDVSCRGVTLIKSVKWNTFIRFNSDRDVDLTTNQLKWEQIILQKLEGGKYAIKSAFHSDMYLRVGGPGEGNVVNTQTYIGDYEKFYIERLDGGRVAFKSAAHGNYIRARSDGNIDTQTFVGSWEKFTIVNGNI